MLFTRCPDCQTNFHITAKVLLLADGKVRCGCCDTVFLAYDGLGEQQSDTETQSESPQATERMVTGSPNAGSASIVILADTELSSQDNSPAPEISLALAATAFNKNMTAEEIDAALSDDLELDSPPASLEQGSQESVRQGTKSYRWLAGSIVLVILLTLQTTHAFRAELATRPMIGPLVRAGYSALGFEITPEWDLGQYEILDWVATTEPSTTGEATLTITARIRNNGPAAQPYPSIHLELTDRWEQTVGSRVFAPAKYLPPDHGADRLMAAGTTVPARLDVVDRNEDAYGFELDVCVEVAAGIVACKADAVFD
ncbi:MAG: DUF3426 domain-containing protein [Gammaproteobacteria bacterium]|nr:MAG: DUF3426 domain-containing protein [Gammaproteobacteria bacterium]